MKNHIVVAAIITNNNNKILCVQRKKSKYDYISFKYEFPGGKVEPGETKEEAIIREIKEELDIDIQIMQEYLTVNHTYPDFSLTMISFCCSTRSSEPVLKEHIAYQWLDSTELEGLDWAAADLPIVHRLMQPL
jgi:8-oxo-dGTP diphosphatase